MKLNQDIKFFSMPAFAFIPTKVIDHNTDQAIYIWFEWYKKGYLFSVRYGLMHLYYRPHSETRWHKYMPKSLEEAK